MYDDGNYKKQRDKIFGTRARALTHGNGLVKIMERQT